MTEYQRKTKQVRSPRVAWYGAPDEVITVEPNPHWHFVMDESGDLTASQLDGIIRIVDEYSRENLYLKRQRDINKLKEKGEQCELWT